MAHSATHINLKKKKQKSKRPYPWWLYTPEVNRKRARTLSETKKRMSDDQLLSTIESLGVTSYEELGEKTSYSKDALLKRLGPLIREEKVRKFKLSIGVSGGGARGAIKSGAVELFDGLACVGGSPNYYFYVNEDVAFKFLVAKLSLSHKLPRYHRARLTHYLRKCLPKTLFERLHSHYSKRGLTALAVGNAGVFLGESQKDAPFPFQPWLGRENPAEERKR